MLCNLVDISVDSHSYILKTRPSCTALEIVTIII